MDGNEMPETLHLAKQELIEALRGAVERRKKRLIQRAWDEASLVELIEDTFDPKPVEQTSIEVQKLPEIPAQFPRLLASYGQKTLEYITVNDFAEWAPYHSWHNVFPPNQPASRAVNTCIEAEIEKLKAEGFKERPREEHERRRQTQGYTK